MPTHLFQGNPHETAEDRMNLLERFQQRWENRESPEVAEAVDEFQAQMQQSSENLSNPGWYKKQAANIAAGTLGIPSDTLGLILMIRAMDPVAGPALKEKLGVKDVWDIPGQIPGNAEAWAETLGGDPEDAGWFISQLISPGPGEAKGALASLYGLKGARRLDIFDGQSVYDDAVRRLAAGDDPAEVFKDTLWYRDQHGDMKMMRSDKDVSIDTTKMAAQLKAEFPTDPPDGTMSVQNINLRDYVKADELFRAYPQLRTLNMDIHYTFKDGKWKIMDENRPLDFGGFDSSAQGNRGKIWIYNQRPQLNGKTDRARSTILHEIQHWIQNYEGFTTGSSSDWLMDRAQTFYDIDAYRRGLLWRKQGKVTQNMSDADLNRSATEFIDKNDPSLRGNERAMAIMQVRAMLRQVSATPEPDFAATMYQFDVMHAKAVQDVVQYLNVGDQDHFLRYLMEHPEQVDWGRRAAERYKLSGGELDARVVQFFRNNDEQEIIRLMEEDGITDPARLGEMITDSPLPQGVNPYKGPWNLYDTEIDRPTIETVERVRAEVEGTAPTSSASSGEIK